ncbi:hypothetical protein DF146_20575 [Burkholderia cenocepacia]|nr:hypothetical protein DF146_20575 [Burkholderia cenocepacia]
MIGFSPARACRRSRPDRVTVGERWKGVKCPTAKDDRPIAESTRTGATEVIRHIVMWKLH